MEKLEMGNNIIVIYHKDCPDGIGAAWVFKHKYPSAKTIGVEHNDQNRLLNIDNLSKSNVIMVDISFPKENMLELYEISNSFYCLDHHKSAERELSDLSFCLFDMSRSGAQLAWDYCFSNKPRPWFIDAIGDRDLWTWKIPLTKEYTSGMSMIGYSIEYLDLIYKGGDKMRQVVLENGKKVIKKNNEEIDASCEKAHPKIFVTPLGDTYKVYHLVIDWETSLRSEIGNAIAKRKKCDFAVITTYIKSKSLWKVALRGVNDIDLSLVAGQFKYKGKGGGGHPRAAGFRIQKKKGSRRLSNFLMNELKNK